MDNDNESPWSLEPWVTEFLADPVTKMPAPANLFKTVQGVLDARVLLKNTFGFTEWQAEQDNYEKREASGHGYQVETDRYRQEIDHDRPVYQHYKLSGTVLDVGGGCGTVREFLPDQVKFVSVDPYISCVHEIPPARKEAYACLKKHVNFLGAAAEFLPFVGERFDWVHMRSMLDHVQVPDLALLEARRVLKADGHLLVGLSVHGGKSGAVPMKQKVKDFLKDTLSSVGVDRWKDHHIWHPTFKELTKLIQDNGFEVKDVFWQPHWKDQVCYVLAQPAGRTTF